MAKQYKLSYLLIMLAAIVVTGLATGCKPVSVPVDNDLTVAFHNNYREYATLVEMIMAEGNQKFSMDRGRPVVYQGSDNPKVDPKTIAICQQLMNRTFGMSTRRLGGTIQFVYFEDNSPGSFRSKSVIYDKDSFKDPVWKVKSSSRRYADLWPPPGAAAAPSPIEAGGHHWKIEYVFDKH